MEKWSKHIPNPKKGWEKDLNKYSAVFKIIEQIEALKKMGKKPKGIELGVETVEHLYMEFQAMARYLNPELEEYKLDINWSNPKVLFGLNVEPVPGYFIKVY